ncbi:MAG: cell envelope integrity protein TolA [Thalassovita sp.]|nr:cell envelope integrity protein TolA [Thalassovita sp.]
MNAGQYISGVAHIGLIGWALLGGTFKPAPEPFEVTEVSMISSEEFDAMTAPTEAPSLDTDLAALTPPDPEVTEPEPPQAEAPDPAPVIAEPDAAAPPPEPEETPDVAALLPPEPPGEIEDVAPVLVPPVEAPVTTAPDISDRPQTRPTTRVAPEPVAPPDPDVKIDDIAQEEAVDDGAADIQREQQEQTAEEEAATEIVTEAEASSSAPSTSVRPRTRPTQVARTEPEPDTGTKKAVNEALAQALAGGQAETETPARLSGPRLNFSEKEALRVAVGSCWVVDPGARSSSVTVTVAVTLDRNGLVEGNVVRLVSSEGGTDEMVEVAFRKARRAILRCQKQGFPLPPEKYEQWREIEMTFNPEKMRIK